MKARKLIITAVLVLALVGSFAQARIKLVALPERAATVIRLDNPNATLIEEERVLTLQKGTNKVDFSWNAVSIDADSIRLAVLSHPKEVKLINVSYPPNENALVWEIYCEGDYAVNVRISYLLSNIDRLVTYTAVANKEETEVSLKSYIVLRNFSGEDFENAKVLLDYGKAFERGIQHEETKKLLFLKKEVVPITKIWKFDSAIQQWDPSLLENQNVGIPVSYRIVNNKKSSLGENSLWDGKVRIYQDDGSKSTIFLGEDNTALVPVNEKTELYVGDSRDIVVTQKKMKEKQINIKRAGSRSGIIKYDSEEEIVAKIENFKDSPATITMIQHIDGEWEMDKCNFKYETKDAQTISFEIKLPARKKDGGPSSKELKMEYTRKNIRPGYRYDIR